MAWAVVGVAAFQMVSGAQQAETIRDNAQISKEVNGINAGYAELDAYNAEQEGFTQEARYQTTIDKTLGEQKVALAAKGVDINFGTAAELQSETKLTGFLNKLDMKNRAHKIALGFENQASDIRLKGSSDSAQASYNASAVENAAVLSGLSTAVSGYTRGKR